MYVAAGDALQASRAVYTTGLVEFCTPDLIMKVQPAAYYPTDEYFAKQWYLNNTGQGTNDGKSTTPNADIDAPEAWSITKGNPALTIAVIDDGVTSNHPDLPNSRQVRLPGSNFAAAYDFTNDPDNPSPTASYTETNSHGNNCADIIAATQDNEGIAGIAPNCKIMPIKIPFNAPLGSALSSLTADAIDFATMNGADIISVSWVVPGGGSPAVISAIQNAIDKGKVFVASAGNTAQRASTSPGWIQFPASSGIEGVISVGASDRDNIVANYSPDGSLIEGTSISLVAPSNSAYNNQILGESYNIWTIDNPLPIYGNNAFRSQNAYGLPVVGELLPASGTNYASYTGRFGGTSAAAPQVSGVAALMKSVNPCLSNFQIKDLLQISADRLSGYDYDWNPDQPGQSMEVGYGKLNAYKAVKAAQAFYSPTLDLYTKDNANDLGLVGPGGTGGGGDESPDIWVRNQDDGETTQVHENPEFQNNGLCYVYVRVRNKSCVASTGLEHLSLYWSKASGWGSWPANWDGTQPTTGNKIAVKTIPMLHPGESVILKFPWHLIDPHLNNTWNSCLLSRIDNIAIDPITVYPGRLDKDINENNNISIRNITIVDVIPGKAPFGGRVLLGNPLDIDRAYNIRLEVPHYQTAATPQITREAEVHLAFDEQGWAILRSSGQLDKEGIKIVGERQLLVTQPTVTLSNVSFPAGTRIPVDVSINFLTAEVDEAVNYKYTISQSFAESPDTILGTENFAIRRHARDLFNANAGPDKTIDKNQSVTLSAEELNEIAVYNWYNEDDSLIYTGKNLTVTPDVTKKYKLEVISSLDGFKDYDQVQVNVKKFFITALSPNPASTQVNISYDASNASSAYLMILQPFGNNSSNYILNPSDTVKTLNTSAFQPGIYTIVLVCDGQIADAKALQIN